MLDKDELKKELGVRAKEIIADGLGFREKGGKVLCPLHPDKNPSMSWYKDGLMWRCNACGENIDIYRYLIEFRGLTFPLATKEVAAMLGKSEVPIVAEAKAFDIPSMKLKELTKPFIDYMGTRGITQDTLEFWRVKQHRWRGNDVYAFQYFDEREQRVYVTYRGLGVGGGPTGKGGCEANTKSILWGMWHIDRTQPLVITEGQPDAMVVWQSGYKNVVSIPAGCNNFKWVEHCWHWLQGIPEIIVFADNDVAGLEMAKAIQEKLANVKVVVGPRSKDDPNVVLYRDGPEAVLSLIQSKLNESPCGLIDLSETNYQTSTQYQAEGIETGFGDYDYHVEDWKPSELTVIFGRNGEGKTTFVSQIIAHCIERDVKVFLYSGEMSENKIQNWLYRQIVGANKSYLQVVKTKYKSKVEPTPEVIRAIKTWHKGKLFLFDRSEKKVLGDLNKFFQTMELAARKSGVKLFIIDNLMAILEENADSLYSDQANFVERCKQFAIDFSVHVVLLTHPNKEKKEVKTGEAGNLEKTDISGSNNIPNKADNIIAIERFWDETDGIGYNMVATSLKDRESGQRASFLYKFSGETLRFYNDYVKEVQTLGWKKYLKNRRDEDYEQETFGV